MPHHHVRKTVNREIDGALAGWLNIEYARTVNSEHDEPYPPPTLIF